MAGSRGQHRGAHLANPSRDPSPVPPSKDPSRIKGKWISSSIAQALLDSLSEAGYLLPPEVVFAHASLVIALMEYPKLRWSYLSGTTLMTRLYKIWYAMLEY